MTNLCAEVTNSEAQVQEYPFPQLNQFLEEIESREKSVIHHPYFANKSKVVSYKVIFFLFGLLFAFFAALIHYKNPNWLTYQVLMDAQFIKYVAVSFSSGLSALSFFLAWRTRTEHEVAAYIENQARKRLLANYKLKCEGFCFFDLFPFGREYDGRKAARKVYAEALEKIHHARREYGFLLQRITSVASIRRREKEKLYNQTLVKFNESVEGVLISFNASLG
jgi:hypothetical protein